MLATTFVWRKKFAAEVVVTRKGSLGWKYVHIYRAHAKRPLLLFGLLSHLTLTLLN
jgi:hypothetical protein